MSRGKRTRRKVWDFLSYVKTQTELQLTEDTGNVTIAYANGDAEVSFLSTGAAGTGAIDLDDNGIDISRLISFEALIAFDKFDDVLDVRIGVASAYNADPDAIATSAFFKLEGTGASNAHTVNVECDDGTNETAATDTGRQIDFGEFMRYRIDFQTGTLAVSPPGSSLGGLGSLRYSLGRISNGEVHHDIADPGVNMSIAASTAVVQPMIHCRQLSTAPTATVKMSVREIAIDYMPW